ncbi:MAG: PBP1A family penicillin-binding protein [Desulfovibrionaceae bacterium]|nr:PBP1A family penicillin-binding protein [Desulfovibrionaceae bacterium]MBF0514604.1 PBP1A family penicillin-binding protein [Desulfovibrionaceae bacterium]
MKKLLLVLFLTMILSVCVAAASAVGLYHWAASDLPGFRKLTDYRPPLVTTVYARDGSVLGDFYVEKRFLATLADMPKYLPMAFLAAEDASFYQHEGVDPLAIFRASLKNLQAGAVRQGGSTITQQLIKRLLLSSEKSLKRKLKEAVLAYRLEKYLTKDEILTIYLNQIYLGAKSYGVEAAARTYFGVHAKDLTLAESAVLAGLPQAPTRYNPLRDLEAARARQKYVLERMLEHGWITKQDHDKAVVEPLVLRSMPDPSWGVGAYYLEEVRRQLIERFGENTVYTAGLRVYTGVDLKHQAAAEAAMRRGLVESSKRRGYLGPIKPLDPKDFTEFLENEAVDLGALKPGDWVKALVTEATPKGLSLRFSSATGVIDPKTMAWARNLSPKRIGEEQVKAGLRRQAKAGDVIWASVVARPGTDPKAPAKVWQMALEQEPDVEGGLVSLDPKTGELLALVGGYSFEKSQFNRAVQSLRQPGSSFKPIVYSAAMDNGLTPSSVIMDGPFEFYDPATKITWKPENYEHGFKGPMILRTALALSRNTVTIRVAQAIGIDKVVQRAKDLGITSNIPPYLSISLGAAEVTLINLCQAYTAFARDGSYVKPRAVLSVKSAWGEEIYTSKPEAVSAITPQNAFIMASLLKEVVRAGTATRANVFKRPLAGKTGTTNDEQDAWFIGFTPYLLTGVHIGFDQVGPMGKGETGAHAALPIWLYYRQVVENDYQAEDFPMPQDVVMASVDPVTGLPSSGAGSLTLPFKKDTQPTVYSVVGSETGTAEEPEFDHAPAASGADLLKQIY